MERSIHRWRGLATAASASALGAAAAFAGGGDRARPDLVIASLEAPARGTPGETVSVKPTLRNSGLRRAGRTVMRFHISADARLSPNDTRLTGRWIAPALGAGSAASGRTSLKLPAVLPAGRYRLIACADARRDVRERREGNNCRASAGWITLLVAPVVSGSHESPPAPAPEPIPEPAPAPLPAPDPAPAPDPPAPPDPAPEPAPEPEPEPEPEALVWHSECGGIVRDAPAQAGTPIALDVCGDAAPDVEAEVEVTGTTRSARITRLAAADLPLRIEAVMSDPREAGRRIAWGVDAAARTGGVPAEVRAELDVSAPTRTPLAVSLAPAGGSLGVLTEVFTPGTDALPRAQPWRMRADLANAPASARIDAAVAPAPGASLTMAAPTTVTLDVLEERSGETRRMQARLDNAPTSATFSIAEQASGSKVVDLATSAPVPQFYASLSNPPFSGRTALAELRMTDVPANLALRIGPEGGPVAIESAASSPGTLDLIMSSGPSETIPVGQDGVILRDTPASYLLAARVRQIRRVAATAEPLRLQLDRGGGAAKFGLTLQTSSALTNLVINGGPGGVDLGIDDSGGRHVVSYAGAAPATSLALSTNVGDRHAMSLSTVPLPIAFTICDASGPGCGNPPSGMAGNRGSLHLNASAQTQFDLSDCRFSSACPDRVFASISARKLEWQVNATDSGATGKVWLDTDASSVAGGTGDPDVIADYGASEIRANLPSSFHAQNRFVDWDVFSENVNGTVNCPAGTSLRLFVSGSEANLSNRLC